MFICSNCQHEYTKWQGKCDNCGEWNAIEESSFPNPKTKNKKGKHLKSKTGSTNIEPVKLSGLTGSGGISKGHAYLQTGIHEFDNAIGGRLIKGQVVLLAGSPGVGKSTLSLQITENVCYKKPQDNSGEKSKNTDNKINVLYIAGEETPEQIKQRSDRLGLKQKNVSFIRETNIQVIEAYLSQNHKKIDLLFVDSIQTLYDPDTASSGGSITQVSECTDRLVNIAKGFGITAFIIGHITKSGNIAGPKVLEHMVDTVLHFEGDKKYQFRILRVEKNRFGSTDEVGIFKMTSKGLEALKDTKEFLDTSKEPAPGSVYALLMEGNRPVIVEVQALATKTYFSNPRRTTSGFDLSRLYILLAIIDKHLKLRTYEYDIYVNITGGIKLSDTGIDLAVIKAIISSIKNEIVPSENIYFGEVGLTGEVRKIFLEDKRVKESRRIGFKNIFNSELKNIKNL